MVCALRTLFVAMLVTCFGPADIACADEDIETITRFYLVRHAEKAGSSGNPPLSVDGVRRSMELKSVLRNVPLAAIYSTDTLRTRQTVAPISEASGQKVKTYSVSGLPVHMWASHLVSKHKGKNVLIVGHSGRPEDAYSIPSIAQALSGQTVATLHGDQFANLFVVTMLHDESNAVTRSLRRTWYGALKETELPTIDESDHDIFKGKDVSAVVNSDEFLVIGSDEKDSIQALKIVQDDNGYKFEVQRPYSLGNNGELDIEGLARSGATYYVLGSHSRKRAKVDPNDEDTLNADYQENRDLLNADQVQSEPERAHIYRVEFDPASGRAPLSSDDAQMDLRGFFQSHAVLAPFEPLASKENGIDIEGIAADGQWLYLGFRAPVLRFGFVPVMRVRFNEEASAELRYVTLAGRGIRDITKVENGFLIVAGPVGDSTLSYELYHWDGSDCIPGQRGDDDPEEGYTTLLGTIPTPSGGKAEGIAVLSESDDHYQVLVAYDSVKNGGFKILRAPKPQQ